MAIFLGRELPGNVVLTLRTRLNEEQSPFLLSRVGERCM